MCRNKRTIVPYTKTTQQKTRLPWTDEELEFLKAHPEMTSRELSEILTNRTQLSIRHKRSQIGRWSSAVKLCCVCGSRIVWAESMRARKLELCKGCYLHEMDMRTRENTHANAVRQSLFKEARRRGTSRK